MEPQLVGKRLLIVGHGSSIAEAIASSCRSAGAHTIIAGMPSLDQRLEPPDIHADVREPSSLERAFSAAGPVHGAINCAGVSQCHGICESEPQEWANVLNINLVGAYHFLRAAGIHMASNESVGCILNVSSLNSTLPIPLYSAYCASKAGLDMLTKVAALEFAPRIRVNAIAPGPVETPPGIFRSFPGFLSSLRGQHLLAPRLAEPQEIADVALFLMSASARWITGQVLVVDGGVGLYAGGHPLFPRGDTCVPEPSIGGV